MLQWIFIPIVLFGNVILPTLRHICDDINANAFHMMPLKPMFGRKNMSEKRQLWLSVNK